MFGELLQRSKRVPLDITADFSAECDYLTAHKYYRLYLYPNVHRWRSFKWRSDNPKILDVPSNTRTGIPAAPLLEEFNLIDEEGDDLAPAMEAGRLFGGPGSVPRLRVLVLIRVRVNWTNHPFANLRILQLAALPSGMTLVVVYIMWLY